MKYITIPQLAKMMGVSRVTIYRKVKAGEIPAIKVGHAYVISDKEIYKILGKELSKTDKNRISKAVRKTIKEYGEVLRLLGNK